MKGNFKQLINGEKPVLIDFHAVWCGPCKSQDMVIKDLAKNLSGKVRIIKIDVDKNRTIAQRYNINGVPNLALFIKGKLVWQEAGLKTKAQLSAVVEQFLG